MAAIDQIININITQSGVSVPTTGTTVPLLLGKTVPGWADGDVVHAYSDVSGMLSDGFKVTDPEYLAALALTSQNSVPGLFLVGRRSGAATTATAQKDQITVSKVEGAHVYTFTADGVLYSYTSTTADTTQTVLSGLLASVQAATGATVTGAVNGAALVLTAKTAGVEVVYKAVDGDLKQQTTTEAEEAQPEQLNAEDLEAITAQDGSWYALVTLGASDDEVKAVAQWVQAHRKMYFPIVSSPDCVNAQKTDDIASWINNGSYSRTVPMYRKAPAPVTTQAAWVGDQIGQLPGSNNWAFRTLDGEQPDVLTDAQQLAALGSPVNGIQGKNLNVYQELGGIPVTQMGTGGGGQFVDITIGLDWLYFNLQSSIYSTLVNTPGKVPFTDAGVALLLSAVRSVLDTGVANQLIDGTATLSVTAAKVSTLTKSQKASRRGPTIYFACTLQGAINSVKVNGTVTV